MKKKKRATWYEMAHMYKYMTALFVFPDRI